MIDLNECFVAVNSNETSNSELLCVVPRVVPSTTLDEPVMLSLAPLSPDEPSEKLVLQGIAVPSRVSGHVFLWGSRILQRYVIFSMAFTSVP